jgi:hypothetical protein
MFIPCFSDDVPTMCFLRVLALRLIFTRSSRIREFAGNTSADDLDGTISGHSPDESANYGLNSPFWLFAAASGGPARARMGLMRAWPAVTLKPPGAGDLTLKNKMNVTK